MSMLANKLGNLTSNSMVESQVVAPIRPNEVKY